MADNQITVAPNVTSVQSSPNVSSATSGGSGGAATAMFATPIPSTKITIAVSASGVDRVVNYTQGDQSAAPFLTINSALASLPPISSARRLVKILANGANYAGFNCSGFSGAGDVVLSFATAVPTLTGPQTGAAGVGTTTTVINLPTGSGTNWATDTLRGLFVTVANPNDADLPYVRPIKSKTNTSFTIDAIPGLASGTTFNIVKAGTSLAAGAAPYATFNIGGVYTFNSCPVRTLFAAPVASLDYGLYSTGNALIDHHGAQLKTAVNYQSVYSSGDLYSVLNDSYMNTGSTLQKNGATAEFQNVVADGGIALIQGATSAVVTADMATTTTGIPLTVQRCTSVLIGYKGTNHTAAEAVLFDGCTTVSLQGAGLTGTGNSGYGAEFVNGGQYNIAGASITGTGGDFSIDGSTNAKQTWAQLGTYKAMSRYGGGTMILGGSGAAEMLILESLSIDGTNFDVNNAQEQHGGRVINYGFLHLAAGASYEGLTAHSGGGQVSALPCGLGLSVFTGAANDHDSCILSASGLIGGMMQIVANLSTKIIDIYPPTGAKINALGTNAPYPIAASTIAFLMTRDDGSSGKDFVAFKAAM